jgi:hypothetical protein
MTLADRLKSKRADTRALAKKQKALHEELRNELGEHAPSHIPSRRGAATRKDAERVLTQTVAPWWTA